MGARLRPSASPETGADNPHLAAPTVPAGVRLEEGRVAAVLVCGREQAADFMLDVVRRLELGDVAYQVLEAAGRSWYPGRFWQPVEENEPWLSWSLEACEHAVARVTSAGVPLERVVLAGFSQGGCLVAESVARRPRRYGAVAILTGALIGPDVDSRLPARQSLAGVPVFLATSERDEWVPVEAVRATARYFERADATVRLRVDDDPVHHVNDATVAALRELTAGLSRRPSP